MLNIYITIQPDDGVYEKPKHVAEVFIYTHFRRLLLLSLCINAQRNEQHKDSP